MRHNHLPIEHIPEEIKDKHTQTCGLSGASAPPSKHTPPVGRSAGRGEATAQTERTERKEAQQKIPSYLREVAEYFLLKTGRDKLTDSEIETLKALGEVHTLSRINREISVAVERFKVQGKPLTLLRVDYIYGALKYQSSTKKKATLIPDGISATQETKLPIGTVDDAVRMYQMSGGDVDDLPVLCEMYRLSDEDTRRVFELCGVEYPNGHCPNEEAKTIASG